jgi:hypothetical protein
MRSPLQIQLTMSEADKVYVDGSQPATLQRPDGPVPYYTPQEAVLAWHKLTEKEREKTTIAVNVPGGPIYDAQQIARQRPTADPLKRQTGQWSRLFRSLGKFSM